LAGRVLVAVAAAARAVGADDFSRRKIALDLAQQRDQGGGLLVGQITPDVEGDPVKFWRDTVLRAQQVLADADLTRPMESPLGHTVADAPAIPVIDLYVHAWDLAATINLVIEIPGTVIAYAHDHLDQVPEEILRGENRAFSP